jgi:hypothetical protein
MGLPSEALPPDVAAEEKRPLPVQGIETNLKENAEEGFSKDAQAGVRKVEAAAMVWSKWHLAAVYCL